MKRQIELSDVLRILLIGPKRICLDRLFNRYDQNCGSARPGFGLKGLHFLLNSHIVQKMSEIVGNDNHIVAEGFRKKTCVSHIHFQNLSAFMCEWIPYILKAISAAPTEPQKYLNFLQICPKMPRNGPKITQSGPNMTQNGPKRPEMAQE